jgi:hypothetical protein
MHYKLASALSALQYSQETGPKLGRGFEDQEMRTGGGDGDGDGEASVVEIMKSSGESSVVHRHPALAVPFLPFCPHMH